MPTSLWAPSWPLSAFGVLLFLAAFMNVQHRGAGALHPGVKSQNLQQSSRTRKNTTQYYTAWDRPNCTSARVEVPLGSRAVVDCRITTTFSGVSVRHCGPGQPCRTIFSVKTPGNFTHGWWQLRVQERQATLLITEARATQAGKYEWRLEGLQLSFMTTTLNVTDPLIVDSALESVNPPLNVKDGPLTPAAQKSLQAPQYMAILGGVLLLIVVLGLLFGCKQKRRCYTASCPSGLTKLTALPSLSPWELPQDQEALPRQAAWISDPWGPCLNCKHGKYQHVWLPCPSPRQQGSCTPDKVQ
ncbi:secreted and transmembrane protein 1 [Echinops telfairi]|uniref:Secreted and transmembrane protein 1 n=1 Tax=Echinops telfairi TaxID=9371 RepID=A0AC55DVX5_ECHTE|nr:secreted and transmembrane protein 1 [Echinops telfairi]